LAICKKEKEKEKKKARPQIIWVTLVKHLNWNLGELPTIDKAGGVKTWTSVPNTR
jgi:hypothetical protein